MIRVAGFSFDGLLNYIQGNEYAELQLIVPSSCKFTAEQFNMIRDASLVEEIDMDRGNVVGVVGKYALYGWRKIEKQWNGDVLISWQTNRVTDIEELKSKIRQLESENDTLKRENKEKEDAILELAGIVSDLSLGKVGESND